MSRGAWIALRSIMVGLTVLTLIYFFAHILPGGIEVEVAQRYDWLFVISCLLVVSFWIYYLVY